MAIRVEITALNHDSSWQLQFTDAESLSNLWIDPWLLGEQVDGARWFSSQSHAMPTLQITKIASPQAIVISHPFTDHCHQETLLSLPKTTIVLAVPTATRKITRWQHFEKLNILQAGSWVSLPSVSGFEVAYFASTDFLDLVHNALAFRFGNEKSLVYAPHGCAPVLAQRIREEIGKPVDVLLTTHTHYSLPFYLGGPVNLGIDKMAVCAKILKASTVIGTHDEAKHASGIVSKLAKVTYAQHPKKTLTALGFTGTYLQAELGRAILI